MGERRSPAARQRRTRLRNGAVLVALLGLGALLDPAIVAPLGPLAAPPERVGANFARCGTPGVHAACVIDGDTIRLGTRSVRLIGIDAPELSKPRCPAEARLAERAADRLMQLLNQGDFDMIAHRFHGRDRFGRDLRKLSRGNVNLGHVLVDEGLAHRFWGLKTSWC